MQKALIDNYFPQVLNVILEHLFIDYIAYYSSAELKYLIYPYIQYGPPLDLFIALVEIYERVGDRHYSNKLASLAQVEHLKFLSSLIRLFFKDGNSSRWKELLTEITIMDPSRRDLLWPNILMLIGSLPERISNALRENTPRYFTHDEYYHEMLNLTFELISTDLYTLNGIRSVKLCWDNISKDTAFILLINKLSNIGKSHIIAKQIEWIYLNFVPRHEPWSQKLKAICKAISAASLEKIFIAMMKSHPIILKEDLSRALLQTIGELFST